jgi:hypothetical protein
MKYPDMTKDDDKKHFGEENCDAASQMLANFIHKVLPDLLKEMKNSLDMLPSAFDDYADGMVGNMLGNLIANVINTAFKDCSLTKQYVFIDAVGMSAKKALAFGVKI